MHLECLPETRHTPRRGPSRIADRCTTRRWHMSPGVLKPAYVTDPVKAPVSTTNPGQRGPHGQDSATFSDTFDAIARAPVSVVEQRPSGRVRRNGLARRRHPAGMFPVSPCAPRSARQYPFPQPSPSVGRSGIAGMNMARGCPHVATTTGLAPGGRRLKHEEAGLDCRKLPGVRAKGPAHRLRDHAHPVRHDRFHSRALSCISHDLREHCPSSASAPGLPAQ